MSTITSGIPSYLAARQARADDAKATAARESAAQAAAAREDVARKDAGQADTVRPPEQWRAPTHD